MITEVTENSMLNRRNILIVDDKLHSGRPFSEILSDDGYAVFKSAEIETAINMIQNDDVAAIVTDDTIHYRDGMKLYEYITENYPDIPVILITDNGHDKYDDLSITRGIFCYFRKPLDYHCLKGILARAIEQRFLKRELLSLKKNLIDGHIRCRIIGNTLEMRRIIEVMQAVKDSDSNLLICGETGTGKELIARTISADRTHGGPFIVFNCAALPKELVETELFGWEARDASEKYSTRMGKFEEASKGTLFLKEIGALELSLQAKLLRILQEKYIQRFESSRRSEVNFRLISSSSQDLKKEIQNGNFREDLFYRINQIEIKVPSLKERKDDIPLLAAAFLNEFCVKNQKPLSLTEKAIKTLENYSWPGNVRQLRNVIERAVILATEDKITQKELPDDLLSLRRLKDNGTNLKTFKEMEMEALKEALKACRGNKSKASRILGISRKAFYKRLKECQLLSTDLS